LFASKKSKVIIKKKREGGGLSGGSAFSSLAQTKGGGGLTVWPLGRLGGLEVNIGGQLQNDLTLISLSGEAYQPYLNDLRAAAFDPSYAPRSTSSFSPPHQSVRAAASQRPSYLMRTVVPAPDFLAQLGEFDAQILQTLEELIEPGSFQGEVGELARMQASLPSDGRKVGSVPAAWRGRHPQLF
jgi:hypothetical protein